MLSRTVIASLVITLVPLAAASTASANGLTTHVWITRRALEKLPDGELKTLLSKPELLDYLVSGTIFPDGGYAAGDGYGELAHWEPFQLGYLEYIKSNYQAPFAGDAEAEKNIAFLFGLASHGMADQVFDSLYMQRAKVYDASSDWAGKSMDEATDVLWASLTEAQPVPPRWVPVEAFTTLFLDTGHHRVDEETMLRGQNLAGFAVSVVGMLAQDREAVRDYSAQFPWATSHLQDALTAGRPELEAELIASYWQRHWGRLNGDTSAFSTAEGLVLGTIPAGGGAGLGRELGSVESRISIAFARRFMRSDVTADHFRIEDSSGRAVPFEVSLFYGDHSHVVHLIPMEELAADETYSVTVDAGLRFAEDASMPAPYTFQVSTKLVVAATDTTGESACSCVLAVRDGSSGHEAELFFLAALAALSLLRCGTSPRKTQHR
jgi:hypothetical protein